ncbi:MAG: molybdate transport system ATP-binding protein [Halieaceae bacterium]|jgi:molybdate transport system ATP-binding protein
MTLKAAVQLNRADGFKLSVDLELPRTGVTALYGHSGAGKTTLLRCIAGLERGELGTEIHCGEDCWQNRSHFVPAEQRGIGYVFQDARLLPHLTTRGNLDYAVKYSGRWHNNPLVPNIDQVVSWLGLESLLNKPATELSGGQAQRVAIARALLCSHNILVMDEPVSALDGLARQHILNYLDSIHRELEIPILYISHNLEEVSVLADHLVVMENGEVIERGSPLALSSQINLDMAHDEQAAAIISGKVSSIDTQFKLTEINLGTQVIYLAQSRHAIGDQVRVRVPARDVSVTLARPERTSILNILPCRIDQLDDSRATGALLRLEHDGQYLLARVTHKSVAKLALEVGMQVFAQIKSVALLSDSNQPTVIEVPQ